VFRSDSEEGEEFGFADTYKNEILKNKEPKSDDRYKGLIAVLSLTTIILGGALLFYIYSDTPSSGSGIEEVDEPEESLYLNNIDDIEEDNGSENYIEDLAKLSEGVDSGN